MEHPEPWVPTIDDLRVKLCYICREEEFHDKPEDPPVPWVHPCNCTLVAHESCLLNWIKAAQQEKKNPANALKCPQCGAVYDLESENPPVLRFLNIVNTSLSAAGKAVSITGLGCLIVSFFVGGYVLCTSYGAYAVREFLGEELHNLLLTDDPSNWPWHAYFNLPLIPLSLIFSRTRVLDAFPLVPLYLAWTSSPPVPTTHSIMTSRWRRSLPATGGYPFAPIINWPPSPLMTMILFPIVTSMYKRYMTKLRHWVMDTEPSPDPRVRRIVWALNEDGPAQLRVQIGANIDPAREPREQGEGAPAADAPPAAGENQDEEAAPQDPAAVAERTIRVTSGSLGRFIGGALMIPMISNVMGSIIYRLSKRSTILSRFFAINGPHNIRIGTDNFGKWFDEDPGKGKGVVGRIGLGIRLALSLVFGGTRTFAECDPVWWRNSIGLGVFVIAKDCLTLFHLWLMKREIETRKVKNRTFAGVDVKELDLINPLNQPQSDSTTGPSAAVPVDSGTAGDDASSNAPV